MWIKEERKGGEGGSPGLHAAFSYGVGSFWVVRWGIGATVDGNEMGCAG